MFDRLKSAARKGVKKLAAVAAGAALLVGGSVATSGSAMAQAAAIDTTDVVATIGTGLVAIAAIGAAFLGFKYLKKVWNRL